MVKKNPKTLIRWKIDFLSRLWNYENLSRSHWGRTRDTAFLIDKWFIQNFHTTVVGISWLLLLKPHLLTSWNESRDKKKADFYCWEVPTLAKEVAGTCFSTLFLNTQLGLQNWVTSSTKKVLPVEKDPHVSFQRNNLADFQQQNFEWVMKFPDDGSEISSKTHEI